MQRENDNLENKNPESPSSLTPDPQPLTPSKDHLWLIAIILAGFALRLVWLGKQSLWYDEGVSWMLSQMSLPDLIRWTADDIQPPLYYLLLWATDIAWSDSEWALRFPSALFSTLTIPLIYTLARKLFSPATTRSAAPLLAAALLALSPLMVYYSQEARMYTLLTLQATLSSYLLLKILHPAPLPPSSSAPLPPSPYSLLPTPYSLTYLLTAAAALYTHYFAAFLLVAHAGYALIIWWRQQFPKAMLIQLLWSFGGTLLLFAPWIPILTARLGDDPSYWPGALKLNEVLRKLLITFTLGETVIEQSGWWLTVGYLALLLIYATIIVTRHSSLITRHSSLVTRHSFLFLWLLVPITLILLLSYQSPKFNPRYTLLSWPAFALILACVLAAPLPKRATKHASRITQYVLRLTLLALTLFLFLFSLNNWFFDTRFSKDDFKALAQFVRERQTPDETVLLSSGHLFPVWAYYYGWEKWTPLPWMLRLDVNRVTDLSIAKEIGDAVAGKGGVWLVTWQNEVIDPNGVIPFWLDRIGERPLDAGDFWGVGLEHWRLEPEKITLLGQEPVKHPQALNFNNQVDLLGMTQLNNNELVLFWQPRQPLPDNLVLTLDITDSDGFDWDRETAIGQPGSGSYPPSRWPIDQVTITRHALPWQTGTPPGLYVAEIGLGALDAQSGDFSGWDILDAQGRPQRRTALLDFINLSHLIEPPNGPLSQKQTPLVDFSPIITLRRAILPQSDAQPGDHILLALLWQAGQYNLDDVSLAFDLVDAAGQEFRVGYSLTPSRNYNLPRWEKDAVVLGQYWLDIPPQADPGPATLNVHLVNAGAFDYDEVYPIGQIEILPAERNFTPPAATDIPLDADFHEAASGGQITLLGADCPHTCTAAPGNSITLTLHWRADAPTETGYTIFTHALDAAENVVINADHAPPKPTQGWVPGEIISDPVSLTIPPNLPPGKYPLEIGLYDAADPAFTRLPLSTGDTRVLLPLPLEVK